jgi:hypothetical protein
MNTIKPNYSYADPKSEFVWVKHGKKTILEKRVISEYDEHVKKYQAISRICTQVFVLIGDIENE